APLAVKLAAPFSLTTCLPDPATHAPWHPATGLGVCASCLSCLLVLISPFYEHRSYRTATGLRQPSSNHLLRYLPLAIKLVAFGEVAFIQVGKGSPHTSVNW